MRASIAAFKASTAAAPAALGSAAAAPPPTGHHAARRAWDAASCGGRGVRWRACMLGQGGWVGRRGGACHAWAPTCACSPMVGPSCVQAVARPSSASSRQAAAAAAACTSGLQTPVQRGGSVQLHATLSNLQHAQGAAHRCDCSALNLRRGAPPPSPAPASMCAAVLMTIHQPAWQLAAVGPCRRHRRRLRQPSSRALLPSAPL